MSRNVLFAILLLAPPATAQGAMRVPQTALERTAPRVSADGGRREAAALLQRSALTRQGPAWLDSTLVAEIVAALRVACITTWHLTEALPSSREP